jgi:hypothetical protein
MSSPRGGYHSSTSSGSNSHCSTSYTSPVGYSSSGGHVGGNNAAAAAAVFGGGHVPSPQFLNGMSHLMNSAFSSVGQFGLASVQSK